jgi:hypothetical protein
MRADVDCGKQLSLSVNTDRRTVARTPGAAGAAKAALWLSEVTGASRTRGRTSEP